MSLILMRSPTGGAGTTFLTARLAIMLAARGHDVAAVDCTEQDSLKLFFGLAPNQALGELGASDARGDAVAGVQIFTAPRTADGHLDTDALLDRAESTAVHLLDLGSCGRGMRDRLLPHAALELSPLVPSPIALAALTKVDADRPLLSLASTAFVLNRLDDRMRLSRDIHSLVRTLLGDQLLGTVRRDEAVNEAIAAMKPLEVFAPSSVALTDLAKVAEAVERRCGWQGSLPREVAA
jgi:chromosome partitioning protein